MVECEGRGHGGRCPYGGEGVRISAARSARDWQEAVEVGGDFHAAVGGELDGYDPPVVGAFEGLYDAVIQGVGGGEQAWGFLGFADSEAVEAVDADEAA